MLAYSIEESVSLRGVLAADIADPSCETVETPGFVGVVEMGLR